MNRYGNYPNLMMNHSIHPSMFTWGSGFLIIPLVISFVALIDLILLGIWLSKQIRKK
jgi:hypothetical protein